MLNSRSLQVCHQKHHNSLKKCSPIRLMDKKSFNDLFFFLFKCFVCRSTAVVSGKNQPDQSGQTERHLQETPRFLKEVRCLIICLPRLVCLCRSVFTYRCTEDAAAGDSSAKSIWVKCPWTGAPALLPDRLAWLPNGCFGALIVTLGCFFLFCISMWDTPRTDLRLQ